MTSVRTSAMAAILLFGMACDPKPIPAQLPPPEPAVAPDPPPISSIDDARGGQLYDCWWALEPYRSSFVPDDRSTVGTYDGRGGPNGDGTLNDERGERIENAGHDYRLKNFFGWDLRGAAGLYGPKHHNKPFVLAADLLASSDDANELSERLRRGGEGLPAFGQVLEEADLQNLAHFIVRVRDGALARPDQIYLLEEGAPKSYRLREGADPARGREFYAKACSRCHGRDGRTKVIDDAFSVGSHARTAAYEDWFKILSGQPGTAMGRQLPAGLDGAAQGQLILDVLAALCDREAFPPHLTDHDAPQGDVRCGAYSPP
jgi:mono/diheme cytochrome c family protein